MEHEGTEGPDRGEQAVPGGGDGAASDARKQEFESRVSALEAERQQCEDEGDQSGQASALRKLGDLRRAAGHVEGAREAYSKAKYLYQLAGNSEGAAGLLLTLGNMEARQLRYDGAVRYFHEAGDLYRRLVDPEREANTLLSEGDAYAGLEEQTKALTCFESAGTLFARLDDTLGQAHTAFRVGMLALNEDPSEAEQHLELAERLYADHVGRAAPDTEAPLPTRVTDSRRYPPFVMQRVCLRERQALGTAMPTVGSAAGATAARKSRFVPPEATSDGTSWTIWIGIGLLVVGTAALVLPGMIGNSTFLFSWLDSIGRVVGWGSAVHIFVAVFGAVTGIVAARQLGISAPVVLLAMGIGFGAIFHEISRGVFVDILPEAPPPVADAPSIDAQGHSIARAAAARLILDARSAITDGNLDNARAALRESYDLAAKNIDVAGQVRALEELFTIETAHGTLAERLDVAERLYDDLRGRNSAREREVLEELVALVSRLEDPARLRATNVKLLLHHERSGNQEGEVSALLSLAAIDRDALRLDDAYEWYRRAHGVYQTLRDPQGQVGTLLALGEIDARLGRLRRAYGRYYHAFAMYRELGDESGQAAMLLHMGTLDEAAERYEEASAAFRQSQRMYVALGDREGEAQAALRFAATQAAHGNERQARDAFRRGADLFHELGDVGGEARVYLGLAHLARKGRRADEARTHYRRATELYGEADDPRGQLAALREIALLAHEEKKPAAAQEGLAEVRRLAKGVPDPTMRASLLLSAGDLARSLDDSEKAADIYREALYLFEDINDLDGGRAARERLERISARG